MLIKHFRKKRLDHKEFVVYVFKDDTKRKSKSDKNQQCKSAKNMSQNIASWERIVWQAAISNFTTNSSNYPDLAKLKSGVPDCNN